MSSGESNGRPRRIPTRNSSLPSSSSSVNGSAAAAAAPLSSSQRSVRATRAKTPIVVDDSSSDSSSSRPDEVDVAPAAKTFASANNAKSKSTTGATSNKVDLDKVAQLETIMGLSRSEAVYLLEASSNNLERAIELHLGGGGNNADEKTASSSQSSSKAHTSKSGAGPSAISSNKRYFPKETDDSNSASEMAGAAGGSGGDDNVRAPIPQKSEKLLDYDPYALAVEPNKKRLRSVFDGNHDDYNEMSMENVPSSSNSSKMKSLAAMYRPPIELLFRGTFEASKIQGTKLNKWVMLNVQNQNDFACQCLNRDLWRDDTVKEIINANFIFVQIYSDSIDGKKLAHYYNISAYPFLAIIDPRTGENVLQFNSAKLDQLMFCEKITNFLDANESPKDDTPATSTSIANNNHNNSNDNNVTVAKTNGKKIDDECDIVEIEDDDDGGDVAKKSSQKNAESKATASAGGHGSQRAKAVIESLVNKAKLLNETSDEDEDDDDVKKENSQTIAKTNGCVDIVKPQTLRYEIPDSTLVKDCIIRIMCPNGDRLDYCTNGDCKFKQLVDYLKTLGYGRKRYELIERLMPTSSTVTSPSAAVGGEKGSSEPAKLSQGLSDLLLTNQSRNLLKPDNNESTYKQLDLYPRVLLLLQQI